MFRVFSKYGKKTTNRVVNEKLEPVNFMFVEKTENPDISFRRVGVNAGTIDKKIDEKKYSITLFYKIYKWEIHTRKYKEIIYNHI